MAAGTWSRRNVAHYGDVELNGAETDWTLGTAVRVEHFDDFGTTMNSKLSEQRVPRPDGGPASTRPSATW